MVIVNESAYNTKDIIFTYPFSIKSIFSNKLLKPPEWLREIEELAFDEKDILDTIGLYEFYIALIMRCTSFIHSNTYLYFLSEDILNRNERTIKDSKLNSIFLEIIEEIDRFLNSHKFAAGINREHTQRSYQIINDLSTYCFGENENHYIHVSNFITDDKNKNDTDLLKFIEGIKVYYFKEDEYSKIASLLDYFDRVKRKITVDDENKKINKQLNEQRKVNERNRININKLIGMFVSYSNFSKQLLESSLADICKMIQDIKNNQHNISDEINKNIVEFIKEYYKRYPWMIISANIEKLYMLHMYKSFIPILDKLIELGYVDYRNPEYYSWIYKEQKKKSIENKDKKYLQPRYDLLCCLILDTVFLPQKKSDDYLFYCKDKYFKPFADAFNIIDLFDSARKIKGIPSGYEELINELDIRSSWFISKNLPINTKK